MLSWVRKIPPGKVASYGQIAALAGSPRAARAVGKILHRELALDSLPWQRVINSKGYISTTCLEHPPELQAELLKSEGVTVTRRRRLYRVDRRQYFWQT